MLIYDVTLQMPYLPSNLGSLIDVERGLVQWRVELDQAKEMIVHWEERGGASPSSRTRSDAKSLEDWKDAIAQIEENIKEILRCDAADVTFM